MKKRIAVYGAGGFGKEIRQMVEEHPDYDFAGFLDDFRRDIQKVSEGEFDDLLFAISDTAIRQRLVEEWKMKSLPFETFIDQEVRLNQSVKIGRGSIICPGTRCTVDISIGKFCIVNLNSVIGHDTRIGNYCSIMPSGNIAGNVKIGNNVFIGASATILQGVEIGDNAVIGASSLVNKDVPSGKTFVGVPAKELIK